MGPCRLLCFGLLFLGALVGCSKSVEVPPDPDSQSRYQMPTFEEQAQAPDAEESVEVPRPPDPVLAELFKKPITTDNGEVGKLLKKWYAEGTASGNAGDYYDNRDGGHSDLEANLYPQVQRVTYSAAQMKDREHWALYTGVRPHVTFGNSSTYLPVNLGGSNPRSAYGWAEAFARLAEQYRGNNLYIYPELGDHCAGHNGVNGGHGDLYPTNTPYLVISQGISWSDQPFMRAIPATLAAFRPEVKRKLVESGLLMPTVQMILRTTNKHLANPKEYLTGKAHPSVFEGSWVDAPAMARLAHEITADKVPPLVQMKVLEEDAARNGRDFFEPPGATEELASSPQVIARIWRGKAGRRRMVVSAAGSVDLNKRPLTFTWVVLRGDENRIRITPRNKAGSEVEIVVGYHPRRPVAPGDALESNRVDIGVFVHNGAYYSAPGFVTFFTLDNESRTQDEEGRPLEIGYGAGDVQVRVSDYGVFLRALAPADGLAARVFQISSAQRAALEEATRSYQQGSIEVKNREGDFDALYARREEAHARKKKADAEVDQARKADAAKSSDETRAALAAAVKEADEVAARGKAIGAEMNTALNKLNEAEGKLQEVLEARRPGLSGGTKEFLDRKLEQLVQSPDLFNAHHKAFRAALEETTTARKNTVAGARQRLLQMGLATDSKDGRLAWQLIRSGDNLEQRLTEFERQLIASFNAALLSELVSPGALSVSSAANFVDQRLFTAKSWRDVYHYDARGKLSGWTRHDATRTTDFTEDGLVVLVKDAAGRPTKAQTVRYQRKPTKDPAQPDKLEVAPGEEVVTYSYEGGERVEKSRTRAKEKN